ncbi:hypothetical protein D3C72_1068050 [compost metagenome]
MKFSKYLAVSILLATTAANAMDVSGVTVNGEVSADYSFFQDQQVIPYVDGAQDNAYRLNKAQLLFKKETEQISFLGRIAYSTSPVAGQNVANLEQVELFYKLMPNVHVGAGRFLTTMGYESLLKTENYFYNNTIAYQAIVPGYGEGVRAKYVKGEDLTVTLTSMNRANEATLGEDNNSKATELSATGAMDKMTWFAGYQMGTNNPAAGQRDDRTATSIWAQYKMDNMLAALTFDSKTSKLEDAGLNWSSAFSGLITYGYNMHNFGLRWEHLEGASTLTSGSSTGLTDYAANKIDSITATDKIALNENLNAYVEFRYDMADEDSFKDSKGVANEMKTAWMGTLGVLAHF